jgi:GH25 family lysozyme M1 (1,4-beta-N-acetylmuramidase)
VKRGIDLSHYQRVTNWPGLAASNDFAIFKASEGRGQDPAFATCAAAARENAMTWGAYHFFRPDVLVVDQINAYFAVLDAALYGQANLYPALDVESESGLPFTAASHAAPVTAFLRAIVAKYGKAIVYTSQMGWHQIGNPAIMSDPDVLLWVAHYTSNPAPAVPMGKQYTLWQHGLGPVPGVVSSSGVDLDLCPGDLPIIRGADPSP